MKTITITVNGTPLEFTPAPPKEVGFWLWASTPKHIPIPINIKEQELKNIILWGGFWHRLIPEGIVNTMIYDAQNPCTN